MNLNLLQELPRLLMRLKLNSERSKSNQFVIVLLELSIMPNDQYLVQKYIYQSWKNQNISRQFKLIINQNLLQKFGQCILNLICADLKLVIKMEDIIDNQLLNLFKSMFNKESLRRNVYLFNALNQNMELSIKTIVKERRVAQITSDSQRIINALTKCPNVTLISHQLIRLQIPGDQLIVKINSTQSQKLTKKQIMQFTKQMKCEVKEDKNGLALEFQSLAAVSEFIQRIKQSGKNYTYQIVQKSPYLSLQESINRIRKQKKVNNHQPQNPINYRTDYNFNPINYNYPIFIRRAVDSDDEQFSNSKSRMEERQKVSYQMNEFDFPSVEQK